MAAAPPIPPPGDLTGRHVELVPLAGEHAAALLSAATVDRTTYGYTEVPATVEHMDRYIATLLAKRDVGTDVPFAQRRLADGRLVGCTRYLEIRRWRGRAEPDEVEIGGTWLAADVQRTAINTEAKLLLLTHAFETWHVVRVAIATDDRNERSRAAIDRLGARFEGVLRHHRPSTVAGEEGRPRDTALYSITDDDWPAVRSALLDRLRMTYGHA
jgi:RimJ/RimL family protein N-acetyltransferase